MKNSRHVVYLIVREAINNSLLRRQVLELLCEIKAQKPDLQITLINFLPIYAILKHKVGLKQVREFLEHSGIHLRVIPSLVPWPIPHLKLQKTGFGYRPYAIWNKAASNLLGMVMWPVMLYYYLIHGVRLFHCRSYPPAYAAILFKKIFPNTKVIFDPRSDFPEENVTAGYWEENDKAFSFWKSTERQILRESDSVACIAPSFVRAYKLIDPQVNSFLVPNNVDIKKFRRNNEVRIAIRRELNIAKDEIMVCYLGEISTNGWNRISTYIDAIKCFCTYGMKFHFLFIVPRQSKAMLDEALSGSDISARVTTLSIPDADVPKYLWASDYGIQLHPKLTIRTGTKVGEYLAAGLPIILNRNAIGAVELVKEWQVGVIIDGGTAEAINLHDKELLCSLKNGSELARWSTEVSEFAKGYFDNKVIAAKYIEQYEFASKNTSL
jgi:glycosyltransferase involved in cell wall biosynthesis